MAKSQNPRGFPIWALAGVGAIGLIVIVLFVAIRMLNAPEPDAPTAIPTIAPTNTAALVVPPTSVPTLIPETETSPGTSFTDEFENQLMDGWTWLAEDPARWSLSEVPGSLQIMVADASLDGPILPANILVREPPDGDFEITTLLRFAPYTNFQFAGFVIFQEHGNALQFGRAFCDLADFCVGDGIYFDNFENGSINGDNYKTPFSGEIIYLRIGRVGNTYTGYYSEDGENWIMTGEHIRNFSEVRVGLMAAQSAEETPALFDYFTITSLNQ